MLVEILHKLDFFHRAPLHYGSISIHITSIISYLFEEGQEIAIDQQDNKGMTSLHVSISSGNLASVKELLDRGSDPFLKNNSGCNALHLAVLHNRMSIISELLKVSNSIQLITDVNSKGYSPVHIGVKLGLRDVVINLMYPVLLQCPHHNVKDPYGNNYIHLAAASGDWKLLLEFLDLPNVNKLLHDSNNNGSTPLHCAAKKGSSLCVEHLLNEGAIACKGYKGVTPFMIACSEGNVNCARLLYKAYMFQLDWQDVSGNTVIHRASQSGSPAMIQYLLDLNCKILHNNYGESFLDMIVKVSMKTVDLLW